MAEALPHPIKKLQPMSKPKFFGSLSQLDVTPEKEALNRDRERNNAKPGCRKKVVFVDELKRTGDGRRHDIVDSVPEQYPSLANPQLNSTFGVSKQMEKLKLEKVCSEKMLTENLFNEDGALQSVNEKASTVLNFKRHQHHFTDLIPVEVDKDKDLIMATAKRISYKIAMPSKGDEDVEEDIMEFWTDDLITDNPKLDYDKDIDKRILEPDILVNDTGYLTELYFCKEIASQFR